MALSKKAGKNIASLINSLNVANTYCSRYAVKGDFDTFRVFFKSQCYNAVALADLGIELPAIEYYRARLDSTPEEFEAHARQSFEYERSCLKA